MSKKYCKSVEDIPCPNVTGMNGKSCEDLTGNECQYMMTEYGCCWHGEDAPDDGQGDAPKPTNNPDDWIRCGENKRYVKYMPEDNKKLCHCRDDDSIHCGYENPRHTCFSFFQKETTDTYTKTDKPWEKIYKCIPNYKNISIFSIVIVYVFILIFLASKGKLNIGYILAPIVVYICWMLYANLLGSKKCPSGSSDTGFRSCLQHTPAKVHMKFGKCTDSECEKVLAGSNAKLNSELGCTCVMPCMKGFKRRSNAAGTAFCDAKMKWKTNPFE